MAGTMPPVFRHQFTDSNGDPLDSGTVEWFLAGTDTRESAYSDIALNTAIANPYTLPASGKLTFYLSPSKSYTILVKDSDGNTVDTIDNIPAVPESTLALDVEAIAGENIDPGEVVYMATGSGGTTAGRWYLADMDAVATGIMAYAVGIARAAIDIGETGSVRLRGRVTGLSGLVAGTAYYVGSTAGALTSSASRRFVGIAESTTVLLLDSYLDPVAPKLSSLELSASEDALTVLGEASLGGSVAFGANLTPSVLTGSVDNYSPTGWATAPGYVILRVATNGSGDMEISGLAGGAIGRMAIIMNVGAANAISLPHESTNSSEANRFRVSGGVELSLATHEFAICVYDSVTARWRCK
jgi:hypothetical protein